jgi:hypothetical protein
MSFSTLLVYQACGAVLAPLAYFSVYVAYERHSYKGHGRTLVQNGNFWLGLLIGSASSVSLGAVLGAVAFVLTRTASLHN